VNLADLRKRFAEKQEPVEPPPPAPREPSPAPQRRAVDVRPRDHGKTAAQNKIHGKTFCLTGRLWKKRDAIHALIQKVGGIPKKRVVVGLDYLVIGDTGGRKTAKEGRANQLGAKVIRSHHLADMLREAGVRT